MSKKHTTEVAIRREASLAALAWERLETAAKKTMNGGPAPSLQLVADTQGNDVGDVVRTVVKTAYEGETGLFPLPA